MNYEDKPIIVVNATAARIGGALTILNQFLSYAETDSRFRYVIFVSKKLEFQPNKNLSFRYIDTINWFSRIKWDCSGLKRYLKRHNIRPYKFISLQNTTVNLDLEQIIYLHQPIPFTGIKWRMYREKEFKLFLYDKFYKFFIFLFLKKSTQFVVQTEWMKVALVNTGKVSKSKVFVIKPTINLPQTNKLNNHREPNIKELRMFYPASPIYYKNHLLILKALKIVKDQNRLKDFKLLVTFNLGDYKLFDEAVVELKLNSNVEYIGSIPYEDMLNQYQLADLIVFPSYVETFGLPLAEAASLNCSILCSDLPYAREVLFGYGNVQFIEYKSSTKWAEAILSFSSTTVKKSKKSHLSCNSYTTGWKNFFQLI